MAADKDQLQNVPLDNPVPVHKRETDECRLKRNICGHGECIISANGTTFTNFCAHRPLEIRGRVGPGWVDDNECEAEPCGSGRGQCINTGGSYTCRCNHGYTLQIYLGKRTCADVNECLKHNPCGESGRCVNLPGGYRCECYEGYKSKSHRHPVCEDIDECLDPHTCPNEQCENTPGSYECVPCPPGHRAKDGICYGEPPPHPDCPRPGPPKLSLFFCLVLLFLGSLGREQSQQMKSCSASLKAKSDRVLRYRAEQSLRTGTGQVGYRSKGWQVVPTSW
ncbi:LTBP3 protein, partial [Atractosteus spatula]|nr:LTBP3 protein [Atractosteus spatula]